jgi:hypothetical protein
VAFDSRLNKGRITATLSEVEPMKASSKSAAKRYGNFTWGRNNEFEDQRGEV